MKVQSVYRAVCVHLYLSEITLLKESAYTRTATLLLRAINTLPVESETFMGVCNFRRGYRVTVSM